MIPRREVKVFARITLPLKKDTQGSFPGDRAIQDVMRKLGFEIVYEKNTDGTPKERVFITVAGAQVEVEARSTAHYRDLARRNLSNAAPDEIRAEIERFAIYTGASAQFKTNIFVSRANEGDVTIFLYQDSLDQLIPCCQYVMTCLGEAVASDLLDKVQLKGTDHPVMLVSGKSGATISRGGFISNSFAYLWRSRTIETVSFLGLTVAAVISYLVHVIVSPQTAGGTLSPLQGFVADLWPALATASATLLITLIFSWLAIPSNKIQWSWRE